MGLFSSLNTSTKAAEVESLINLITERTGEYLEIQSKNSQRMHPSVSQMLGNLYDSLFKLYYPHKDKLDPIVIKVKTKFGSNNMPISYYIKTTFNIGRAFEEDFDCVIFKDNTQRAFSKHF